MKIQLPTGRWSVPTIVCILAVLILVALPLRIVQHGFLPPDDALRHAAKAVSGKTWTEILLLRPEITIDHNPGWHSLLGAVHRFTGWDARMLVLLSVVTMFASFALSPLPWLKRPEGWVAAVVVIMLVFPYFADRSFAGRPLFLTMGATLTILCLWTRPSEKTVSGKSHLLTIAVIALCAWLHGSWYLIVLLPISFFLARDWKKGLHLTCCWVAGTIGGAFLTGQPWNFLSESALIPFLALGQNAPANSLVGEFQRFTGGYPAIIVVGFALALRKWIGRPFSSMGSDPIFWMAILGWLLGFRVFRFWLDWGLPALALWLAFEFQELFESRIPVNSWQRVGIACLGAFLLFSAVASDRAGRWSEYGKWEALDASRPEHAGWVPEAEGVLYSVNLSVFYQTFFQNPHGNWRYALGFEPSFMRPADLEVYQELWRTLNAVRACAPWVKQMRPADRLILVGGPEPQPAIPELEWFYAAENTWVGRLPR